MPEELGKSGIRPAILRPGDGVRGNDDGSRKGGRKGIAHAALGRSDVADDRAGFEMRCDRFGSIAHRSDGYAEDHQIRPADRLGNRVADLAHKPAPGCALAHIGIGIPSCRRHTG